MFEHFTAPARRVVVIAQDEARGLGHEYIGTEHVLLGVAAQEDQCAAYLLAQRGLTEVRVRGEIERIVGRGDPASVDPRIDPVALATLGIDLEEVRRRVETTFGPGELARRSGCRRDREHGQLPFTPNAKKSLELALREARALGHDHISPQHIVLGLLRSNGVARHILTDHGVDPAVFRSLVFKPDRRAG